MLTRFLCICLSLAATVQLNAAVITCDSEAEWATWQIPQNLVRTNALGHLELVKFCKNIDPVQGGTWRVGSNPDNAFHAIDGDTSTFWRPDEADPLYYRSSTGRSSRE